MLTAPFTTVTSAEVKFALLSESTTFMVTGEFDGFGEVVLSVAVGPVGGL